MSTDFKDLVVETPGVDFRVHRSAFISDDVFQREQKTVFENNWLYFGHTSEIREPGDFITRELAGERLILVRDSAGAVRVLFNSCQHRGALVCREPSGNAAKGFRCLYHAWTYKNSGELVGVAERTSFPEGFKIEENGLRSPRFDIYRDFVFVNFSGDAQPLLDHLGPVLPYLDGIIDQSLTGDMEIVQGSHLYRMGANWKLLVENSFDGYHGLPVHETYFKYLGSRGYDLSGGLDGVGLSLGNGHAALVYKAPFGRSVAKAAPLMTEKALGQLDGIYADLVAKHGEEKAELIAKTSNNIFIYPNLIIIDAASTQLRLIDPISAGEVDVSAWCIGPVGEDADLRSHRIQGYLEFLGPGGFSTPDDNEAIEACQEAFGRGRGSQWNIVSKGLGKDVTLMTDEEQMRAFWRQWQIDIVAGDGEPAAAAGGRQS